jgi:hypothetical protein
MARPSALIATWLGLDRMGHNKATTMPTVTGGDRASLSEKVALAG